MRPLPELSRMCEALGDAEQELRSAAAAAESADVLQLQAAPKSGGAEVLAHKRLRYRVIST